MSISRNELHSQMFHEHLRLGDQVVGEYHDSGRKQKQSITAGDPEEVARIQKAIIMSAQASGATVLKSTTKQKPTAKKIRAKKPRPAEDEPDAPNLWDEVRKEAPTDEPKLVEPAKEQARPASKKNVYLHNSLGKITLPVIDVMENESAYMLVFANNDDVRIIPATGTTLSFTNHRNETSMVYYANALFDWTDGTKRIMILFKTNDDE